MLCVSPTNKHFALKENPLKRSDLDDFVACYNPKNRHERKGSERFKSYTYEELTKRDKHSILSNVLGFPRHAHKFGASRRKAGALPALTSTSSGSKTKASKTAPISPILTSSPPRSSKISKLR
jgi:hypothetical protein